MSRNPLVRLRIEHILDIAEYLRELLNDMTFQQFEANRTVVLAALHSLQTAGEAARAIPEEFRTQHPGLPWREMADMRNVIVHQYFRVDLDVIWHTIHSDFLPLEAEFRTLLDSLPKDA